MLHRYPALGLLSLAQALYWSCSIIGIALTGLMGGISALIAAQTSGESDRLAAMQPSGIGKPVVSSHQAPKSCTHCKPCC